MASQQLLPRVSSDPSKQQGPLDRVRSMSLGMLNLRQLTDTPSPRSPRSPRSTAGSCPSAPSEQQISMQTTMDLLMRLLDDIDAGIPITPLRTAQLRRMLLQTGDLQQPLELVELMRSHSASSYTGSNVLTFLDERCMSLASLPNSVQYKLGKASPLASRSQSFAIASAAGSLSVSAFGRRGVSLGPGQLHRVRASVDAQNAAPPPEAIPQTIAPSFTDLRPETLQEDALDEKSPKKKSLCVSAARLQSGMIRDFIRQSSKELQPPFDSAAASSPSSQGESVQLENPMQSSESPARPPLSRSPSKSPDSAFRRNTEAELAEAQNWRRQADARQSAAAAWLRRSMASTAPEPFLSEGQPQMEPAEAGSDETTPHDSSTNGHSSVLGDGEGATAARAAGSPLGVSFVDLPADSTKEEAAEQPLRTLMTRVEHLLFMANEWAYDTIALGEETGGRPLSCLAFYLIQQWGLISTLRLDERRLINFLLAVEDRYGDHPYHNRAHAADVLHTVHVILFRGEIMSNGFLSPVDTLACYIAAVVHDVDHAGVSNDCLVAAGDPLAIRYNDRSVLENHHCATFTSIVWDEEQQCNFMGRMGKSEQRKLRNHVMEMVLATDMKQHFAIVGRFKTLITSAHSPHSPQDQHIAELRRAHSITGLVDLGSRLHSLKSLSGKNIRLPPEMNEAQKVLALQMVLKVADLGHLTAPLPIHKKWLAGLEEEFFEQGDLEQKLDLPITPFMDRTQPGISTRQVDFFKLMAMPMFTAFVVAFPGCQPLLDGMMANYAHWVAVEEAQVHTTLSGKRSPSLPSSPGQLSMGSPLGSPMRLTQGSQS